MTDVVLLGILIYASLGKLADTTTRLIERRVLTWHSAYRTKQRQN
jgi:sulfonate transport system permease protein